MSFSPYTRNLISDGNGYNWVFRIQIPSSIFNQFLNRVRLQSITRSFHDSRLWRTSNSRVLPSIKRRKFSYFSVLPSFEVFPMPVRYDAKFSVENAVLNLSCSRVKGFLCKITKLSGIFLANILLFFFFFSYSLFIKFTPFFILFIFFSAGYLKKICES